MNKNPTNEEPDQCFLTTSGSKRCVVFGFRAKLDFLHFDHEVLIDRHFVVGIATKFFLIDLARAPVELRTQALSVTGSTTVRSKRGSFKKKKISLSLPFCLSTRLHTAIQWVSLLSSVATINRVERRGERLDLRVSSRRASTTTRLTVYT